MLALIIIGIIVFVYCYKLLQYRKKKKYKIMFGNMYTHIFIVTICWLASKYHIYICIGSMIKVGINIGIYFAYIRFS